MKLFLHKNEGGFRFQAKVYNRVTFEIKGNDRIHELAKTNQKLNIYLEAADGTYRNGYWNQFYIANETDKYRLKVRGYSADCDQTIELDAYEQEKIPCNFQQIPTAEHIHQLSHLKGLSQKISPKLDIPVGILIGVDCAKALMQLETVYGEAGEPFASRTLLGWTLCGEIKHHSNKTVHNVAVVNDETRMDTWTDNSSDSLKKMSQNDLKFIKILEEGIAQLPDGSYSLPLPFKERSALPNNKIQAEKNFNSWYKNSKETLHTRKNTLRSWKP